MKAPYVSVLILMLICLIGLPGSLLAATPGLPFTEDFTDTNLMGQAQTTANWSPEEQALVLAWKQQRYGGLESAATTGADITLDAYSTESIVLGDVDGDGDLDVVAGNSGQPNRLYLNNGNGDFAAGANITLDAHTTTSIALGDVDGDGDVDAVAGNRGQPNRLYLNNGNGDFAAGTNITLDAHATTSIALGDVDGDGDVDVVAGNSGQPNRLYLNNGNGVFAAGTDIGISNNVHATTSVALGDVDGDGDVDVVAGNNNGQRNRLYLNNGTANPFHGLLGSDIANDAHGTFSITLGDVDGDGDVDVVAGNDSQVNRLYLNNGNGAFAAGTNITLDVHRTSSITLGDVDGDGDLDLMAGNWDQANRLYLNKGNGTFAAGKDITADAHSTVPITLGDVDGDGDLDLMAGNWNQANRLYLNNGMADPFHGVFASPITNVAQDTSSIALGDVDGDGDLDVVAGNNGQRNRLYLNNGNGAFAAGRNITLDAHATTSIALGDVDGDGDVDVVAGNDGVNRLYVNNGTATPFVGVTGTDITTDAHSTTSIALGDVDNDGDVDVVAGNSGQPNRLYLNNGNGAFTAGLNITADAHSTTSIALGDVDNDGDVDVVAGNANQANRLYLNNGTATPFVGVTGSDITTDTHSTTSIALGDVDNDGDVDVVAGNDGQPNRLYLNNGNGAFAAGTSITTDTHSTTSIALGDVDNDGDVDIVAGNSGQLSRLYLNNGNGAFAAGTNIAVLAQSIALGDVNRDGHADVVTGKSGGTINYYLNNGTASLFTGFIMGSEITADAYTTSSIALGDVDGDGDVDVVAGNNGQPNRLYLNNGNGAFAAGLNITAEAHHTYSIALADVDGDGDGDVVAGNNFNQPNRLYLNNGNGAFAAGLNITADAHSTTSIALGDVDGDGDVDVVAGSNGPNRMYLNNGTATPFAGVIGSDITADAHNTSSIALGDVDGDGDVDVVAGNSGQPNRMYLNNGTATPFAGVIGSDITADAHNTSSIALGDVDNDGDVDVVAGNSGQPNRMYLNNGTVAPFAGVIGSDITADAHGTLSIALGDVDGNGSIDVVAGNVNQPNRLYLNRSFYNPFWGVVGSDITLDVYETHSVVLSDMNGDGSLDVVAGNWTHANRLYRRNLYSTPHNVATSLKVDTEASNIPRARLTPTQTLPPNTDVSYFMSNNGGAWWYQVISGQMFSFPTVGQDLRWKAELHSLSPVLTPRVESIAIDMGPDADLAITKTDSADPILEGQSVTYTITATNNGPSDALSVVMTDTLPVGVTFDSAATTLGSCGELSGTVTCNIGMLTNGAGANVTIVVTAPTPGLISNTATISGNVTDSIPANNSATQTTLVEADSDGDGLSDAAEAALGTNPNNADTDGDGLNDWEEVNPGTDGYITNPLSNDSDGDGLSDDLEAVFGSDPNTQDSDGGGASDFVEYHRNPQTDPWNPADDMLPGSANNDFDGNGRSDMLWRNTASGLNYLYIMNAEVINSQGTIDVVSDPNWQIVGTGDYDGDNTADILWRNGATGENRIYFMNGNTITSQGSILTIGDTNWHAADSGDYDGDGKSDILWRHAVSGQNHIWFMNGLTIASQGTVNFVPTNWQVMGSGDLDGDGKSDILWRNSNNGRNHAYLMNRNAIASQGTINTVPLNWNIAGTGDYDGDGKSDILWRNTLNGRNHMYFLNGFNIVSQGTVNTVPLNWNIVGDGDYDGDGKADILWRNMSNGRNYMYFMDGNIIAGQGSVNTVSNFDWVVVDVR